MGGSSQSGGGGKQLLSTQSIATPLIQNLFGQTTKVNRFGGFMPASTRKGGSLQFANQVFGPESFEALGGLADPIDIGGLGLGDIGNLITDTAGFQGELARTGFKTDIGPAVELSRMLFEDEFIPGALEQFGMSGLDAGDSDVQSALLREGSRRATELGALDIDLSEAAAQRRLLGLQGAGGVLDLQNLGQATAFAQSDAGQLLNNFLQLAGVGTQASQPGGQSGMNRSGGGILFG
jgi:hypothetical protein